MTDPTLPTLADWDAVIEFARDQLSIELTPRTLQEAVRADELQARRIGRNYRFAPADVIAWLRGPSNYPAPGEEHQ